METVKAVKTRQKFDKDTHNRVIEFINLLKGHKNKSGHDAHAIIKKVFSRGNCYSFARTLKFVFPEGKIYFCSYPFTHAVLKLNGRLYDIDGDVTDSFRPYKFRPITKAEERSARTFCYSHRLERAYGLDGGKYLLEEDEYLQRLNIERGTEVEDKIKVNESSILGSIKEMISL